MKWVRLNPDWMHLASLHPGRRSDARGLWALFWRMLVLTPFVALFGILAFLVVLCLSFMPPFLFVLLVTSQEYLWSIIVVALWFVWLRFGGPARRFVFEGFEHGSL